uniref:GST N-terminal domain-containing protein n=1 Tax=Quercus lobata TaxID=97700 RepID=A0A7N2LF20_QUELO
MRVPFGGHSCKTVNEHLPTPLDAISEPPPLFDGTTRLYPNYACPFAQCVWITRNYKGLHDKIKLVPIDLQNRPAWYKEKVYNVNKVPALEHDGKIIGESLDLIKYVDSNFEGPSLLPNDPAKKEFAEEFIAFIDSLINMTVHKSFKGDTVKEAGPDFDHLENALHKFDDGPFFLGHEFSLVINLTMLFLSIVGSVLADIACIPFVESFQILSSTLWNYDITTGRPKLARWIEGLYGKIKVVPINLQNRPAWYKEEVYPENKVPSLEHNGKIIGKCLDLIKYVDRNFEGPSLLPNDPAKTLFTEDLLPYGPTPIPSTR